MTRDNTRLNRRSISLCAMAATVAILLTSLGSQVNAVEIASFNFDNPANRLENLGIGPDGVLLGGVVVNEATGVLEAATDPNPALDQGFDIPLGALSPFGGDADWRVQFDFASTADLGLLFSADGSADEEPFPDGQEGSLNIFLDGGTVALDFWFIGVIGTEDTYNDDEFHTVEASYQAESGLVTLIVDGLEEVSNEEEPEEWIYSRDATMDRTRFGDDTNADAGVDWNADGFIGSFDNILIEAPSVREDPYLPADLPGPSGGAGFWGVREITGNGTIDSLSSAADSATSGGGTIIDGQFSILDVTDPDTNPQGGPILSGAPFSFLSNTGADDDNITTVAKGRIKVEQGGDYTFQVNSNDGFGLRIGGKDFTSASNGASIDSLDPTTITRQRAGQGLGVVNLEPGEYDLEFVSWEGTGEGFYEVTSAQGVVTDPDSVQWLAVGDSSSIPGFSKLPTVFMPDPAAVFNMGGVPEMPSAPGGSDGGVGAARAELAAGNITGDGSTDIIALHDPESGNNLGGTSTPFPGQVDGVDDNDFTTAVLGQFVVDDGDGVAGELIPLSFSLQSDDNGQIHIFGSSFLTSNQPLVDVDGDMACTGDFNSGNINTTCTISLVEGSHGFEAYHREQGGGAYFQVWWAEGAQTSFNAADFTILSTDDTPIDIPANTGLALVGGVVEPWPGDANGDGHTDASDLNILGLNWQKMVTGGISDADFNGDGVVNASDLNEIGSNWQTWRDGMPMPASVPEPNSIALLLVGLIATCGYCRKHRS